MSVAVHVGDVLDDGLNRDAGSPVFQRRDQFGVIVPEAGPVIAGFAAGFAGFAGASERFAGQDVGDVLGSPGQPRPRDHEEQQRKALVESHAAGDKLLSKGPKILYVLRQDMGTGRVPRLGGVFFKNCTLQSRFNESRYYIKSGFKVQNVITKMEFHINMSRFSLKSRFKESKCAD